jgi:hypothetical protein
MYPGDLDKLFMTDKNVSLSAGEVKLIRKTAAVSAGTRARDGGILLSLQRALSSG